MSLLSMAELDLDNKVVLIREDFNVPFNEDGSIASDTRIKAALPTIRLALEKGAKVMLIAHCGRPKEGVFDARLSLEPVAQHLSSLLGQPVDFQQHWLEGVKLQQGEVVLCENVRFNIGEEDNDEALAKQMAALCDVFVMDAFACAHRAQASTHGVACFAPVATAGPLLIAELESLHKVLENPQRPLVAIVGGSKVSTKLTVLSALVKQVDQLIVGGGIANTLLAAKGYEVGASLYEPDLLDEAKALLALAKEHNTEIPLPQDVLVATAFDKSATATQRHLDAIGQDEMILDIGPDTIECYREVIAKAGTLLWNGPVGVFEFPHFAAGTAAMAKVIAANPGFSVAGGGDTLAAIEQFGVDQDISYISTGGGAFLELVEGKLLPAVEVLQQRSQEA